VNRAHLLAWSAGCAGLTLLAFAAVHGRNADLDTVVRMIVSLGANAVTTGMVFHRQVMDTRVIHERRRHEGILNSLAIAIWEHDFTPVAAAIDAVRAVASEICEPFWRRTRDSSSRRGGSCRSRTSTRRRWK
jgi:hypothetical protein